MDALRELIRKLLKEADIPLHKASRQLGRSDSYLQQFMSRGSPKELSERDRIKLAEILKIDPDSIRGPSLPIPPRTYVKASNNNNHVQQSGMLNQREIAESG